MKTFLEYTTENFITEGRKAKKKYKKMELAQYGFIKRKVKKLKGLSGKTKTR